MDTLLPSSLPPYARMARFASTDAARAAYRAIQDLIFRHEEVARSVYHLVIAQVPHVVVLGEQPGTSINDGLIAQLAARRLRQDGPWSERHPDLPGEPLA